MESKEILKQIIQITGLTQREFAKQIKTTEFQVSHWLSGYRTIRENRLNEILTQFNLKINFEILAR